jgi:hypothetical protein
MVGLKKREDYSLLCRCTRGPSGSSWACCPVAAPAADVAHKQPHLCFGRFLGTRTQYGAARRARAGMRCIDRGVGPEKK